MSSLLLARAVFPETVTQTVGTGAANLTTPDPKEVAGHSTGASYDVDFGATLAADMFLVGFLGGVPTAITVQTATAMGTGLANSQSLTIGSTAVRRRHGFVSRASTLSSRYWRVTITGQHTVGIIAFAKSLQPAFGREWGSGRVPVDRSAKTPLRGGGWGIERGARLPGFQFTMGDLDDDELKTLYNIAEEIGESAPVLVCEDPALTGDDLNLSLHYGLFDRPEAYSRESVGINRWSFRVAGWV